MEYRILGQTGASVSLLGFGASPLGDVFSRIDPEEGKRSVHFAIDNGINLFDVSPYYGRTLAEERLGDALAGKRDRVFLATKCGRYDSDDFDFSAARIHASIDESLTRLKTDYVDLLQAHDVEFGDKRQIIEETIPALRDIQRQGKARFIGISSYQLQLMVAIAQAVPVDTILSYCRYNLLTSDMDQLLTPFVREQGIGLINASPLHMGLLTGQSVPAWHPAPQLVRDAAERLARLCLNRGLDVAAVALRFSLGHPYVSTTLAGMSSVSQVEKNLAAMDLKLDPELLAAIDAAAGNAKNVIWKSGRPENADYL